MPNESPLLITKLRLPAARALWVPRERLFARLDGLHHARAAILSAPPGYGKTTLLVDWLHRAMKRDPAFHPAWLGLDPADNDPIRFWAYVAGAVQEALPANDDDRCPGRAFLDLIRSPQPPPIESALTVLLNELTGCGETYCLVLDDYQVIENEAIHAGLRFVIENQPETLRLVIASRTEPPFAHARYRVRGWLTELRAADLRFTAQEAAAFLRDAMRLDLNDAQITDLEQRSEGWAAALQLAALAIQSSAPGTLTPTLASPTDAPYLLDYLTEEVLSHQPAAVRTFLLYTSVLERFSPQLAAEVVRDEGVKALGRVGKWEVTSTEVLSQRVEREENTSAADERLTLSFSTNNALKANSLTTVTNIITYLEQANLFLLPLDTQRGWYRYHALFAAVLRQRLEQVAPEMAPVLHKRAARWLGEHHMYEDAAHHAFAAGDLELAADYVTLLVIGLIQAGESQTLKSLLDHFPLAFSRTRPALCLAHGWVALYRSDFAASGQWAADAERALQPGDRVFYQAMIDLLRSTVAINHKNFDRAITLARRALPFLPEEAHLLRSIGHLNLGDAYHVRGAFEDAADSFRQAIESAHACSSPMLEVVTIGSLGDLYLHRGRLRQAARTLEMAQLVTKDSSVELPALGKPLAFLSTIYLQWNELERAETTARRALALCEQWDHTEHIFDANLRLAEILQARGDGDGARAAIERAKARVEHLAAAPNLSSETKEGMVAGYRWRQEYTEAQMALRRGDAGQLHRWLELQGAEQAKPSAGSGVHSLLAWYRTITGQFVESLELLKEQQRFLESLAPENRNLWQQIGLLIQLAIVRHGLGETAPAQTFLEKAVSLAAQEGYVRIFLNGGNTVQGMLTSLLPHASTTHMDHLRIILVAFAPNVPSPAQNQAGPPLALVEPLTDRELGILRLLAADRTYPEIAETLYLSVNTVKTHVKRLYAKLGVDSRLGAVEAARRLGIIR